MERGLARLVTGFRARLRAEDARRSACPHAHHIDLFAVGLDRGTYSAWWDGEWHEWFRLAERSFEPNAPITAVSREPNHMDLFAVGPDGGAYSTWWDNGWHDWFPIE